MSEWIQHRLGNVCKIEIGGTPSRSNRLYWDTESITNNIWLSIKDMNKKVINTTSESITDLGIRKSNAKLVKKDTVLMSFKLTVGKVAFAGIELYTNEAIAALETESINNTYLYYGLQYWNILKDVDSAIKGITLNKKKLNAIEIIYPLDKAEQSKIADILSTCDKAIEQTEAIIEKYKRIKTGLMQDLLTKGIDENGNIRSEETHEFTLKNGIKVPKEWEVYAISDVFTLKTGSTPLRKKNQEYFYDGYIPWVKTLDLNETYITYTQEKITKKAVNESSCSLQKIGTILIAMYGGWEQIGRTGLLKIPATTNQALTSLTEPKLQICPEYVQFFLQNFRHKWKEHAASTRKDPNITKNDIGKFFIAIPKFEEQKVISDRILKLINSIKVEEQLKSKYELMKTGLMQDLLSGKVRVEVKELTN